MYGILHTQILQQTVSRRQIVRHNKSSNGDNYNGQQLCTCTLHLVLARDHLRRVGRLTVQNAKQRSIHTNNFGFQITAVFRQATVGANVYQ